MKTIVIDGYPCHLKFETNAILPRFLYGCKTRTKIAQQELKKAEYNSFHHACDFIVEKARITSCGEIWSLGS